MTDSTQSSTPAEFDGVTSLEIFGYAMNHFKKNLIEYVDGKPHDTSFDRWQQATESKYFINMKTKTMIFVFSLDGSSLPEKPPLLEKIPKKGEASISISAVTPKEHEFPVDKVNTELFKGFMCETRGKLEIPVEKNGSSKELTTEVFVDFSELMKDSALQLRPLTAYEQRVFLAGYSLLKAGNEYATYTQIYKAMGGKGRPAPDQIEKISETCHVMRKISIRISNKEEAEAYNYPLFQTGSFYLFPAEIAENVEVNGKIVDSCIHFLKDDFALMEFARGRGQLKALTTAQWDLPKGISMTADNINLDFYLKRRILRMKSDKANSEKSKDPKKRGKYNGKILYNTIYENCGIETGRGASAKDRKQKERITPKFWKLLDHYKATGLIAGYAVDKEKGDGFIIFL